MGPGGSAIDLRRRLALRRSLLPAVNESHERTTTGASANGLPNPKAHRRTCSSAQTRPTYVKGNKKVSRYRCKATDGATRVTRTAG